MASQSTTSTDGPLTLHFHDMTRVAGEMIQGSVELNLISAQEDNLDRLRIKFRGTIHSKITTTGYRNVDHYQFVTLFHEDLVLWARESASLDSDHHTLTLPFEFKLPENLPSSFHCWWIYRHATIGYSLEVVGERAGFHRWNRRIRRLISVVPGASEKQLLAKESLRQGWNGPWQDFANEEKLRQGLWGHYSHARVRLTIPNMSSYPIATPIPFRFHVETDTKPMRISDAPVDKHGKQLFPALPALASDMKLILHRRALIRVHVGAKLLTEDVEDIFPLEGSLGDATRVAAIDHVIEEPQWILAPGSKDEKDLGIWRRAAHFESAVAIPYAPTCSTEILDWEYHLRFVVPFPGLGNNLELEVPIHLDPGSACPPPPIGTAGASNLTYADILPAGPPPPMADLPPAYWAGTHHAWDVDVKS
ncbi:hypothetical protein C8F04DRAFT_1106511 [Mycena alexandri]|uniref:Arrestin-like N-terminal domain-containing protein n=1 Tax=Mycena alexandri TaxID=1745969 RepID=A0AAD6SST4_9AGAR|nr:hypothetical protein C8F04DRAFT_1106511 [Mycena alexandri]